MAVQRWRWWQWLFLSLLVGALLGFAFTRFDVDDTSIATRDLGFFIRHLNLRTDNNESVVDGIRISPPVLDVRGKAMQNVTFWVRRKHKETGRWERVEQYQVHVPQPVFAANVAKNYPTIQDYLAERAKEFPSLDYRYNRYLEPWALWTLCIGGSVVVIGIIFPLLIRLMVKLGLGYPEDEEPARVDLSRVSSRTATVSVGSGIGVTEADRSQLEALTEQLESNVSDMLIKREQVDEQKERQAEEAVVKKLAAAPMPDEPAPVIQREDEPREYGGEYYPVARPVVKKSNGPMESEK